MSDERPLITATDHDLPFDELSWKQFEKLCVWLLEEAGYSVVRHKGATGGDGGVDIEAIGADGRLTFAQCKRYLQSTRFGIAEAKKEIRKVLARPPANPLPDAYLLLITRAVRPGSWAALLAEVDGRFHCDYWDITHLDRRLRKDPDTLKRFFRRSARKARRWNLPPRNGLFEGRRSLLDDLAARLRAHHSAGLTQAIT